MKPYILKCDKCGKEFSSLIKNVNETCVCGHGELEIRKNEGDDMKCQKCKDKNKQIRKLKRNIEYLHQCMSGDIEYTKKGKTLMKEFDEEYRGRF